MTISDVLMVIAVICIWSLLLVNVMLIIAGYLYYIQTENEPVPEITGEHPMVTIMVPAHNEGVVISKTVESCWRWITRMTGMRLLSSTIIHQTTAPSCWLLSGSGIRCAI